MYVHTNFFHIYNHSLTLFIPSVISITVLITGPVTYYLAIPIQVTKNVLMLPVYTYTYLSLYNQRLSCLVVTELSVLPWKWENNLCDGSYNK